MKLCINNAKIRQQEVKLLSSNPKYQLSKTIFTIISVMLLTLFAGEVKIVPFEDTTFRFALGSIVFFLCVLVLKVPILLTGLLTSVLIVPFRAGLSNLMYGADIYEQLIIHSPAATFYIIYTLLLAFINIERLKQQPLLLIGYAAFAEVLANVGEQIASYILFLNAHLLFRDILLLIVVAMMRSLFVVGLYSLVSLNEQKKQTEQLLSIGSNLYTESLYVKKMMELIEGITQDSFKMHQALRQQDRQRATEALMIAQNIHEVKKDLERVYAGLNKIVLAKQSNPYYFHELLHLVVEANTRYSKWQQKQITFQLQGAQNFKTKEPFLLLSVMNNIVANAVE
ncbi:MAG: ATP-binding protein, partial [Lysinibacillus sp.]